jgi:hypothetical protein
MLKGIAGLAAVLVMAGPALAQERPSQERPNQERPSQERASQERAGQESPRRERSLPEGLRQEIPDQDVFRQETGREAGPDAARRRLSQADLNALTDARIGVAKAMLQMTPDQVKLWPPVEEAIRDAAEARYRRIAQRRAMMTGHDGEHEPDPIAVMRARADVLLERGANLRKLADAWQPLYQTLNPDQRDRLRLVASHVLHETRGAQARRDAENAFDAEEGEED